MGKVQCLEQRQEQADHARKRQRKQKKDRTLRGAMI